MRCRNSGRSLFMKTPRIFSLLLALALQVMPLCRTFTTQLLPAVMSGAPIVMRWVIGGISLIGGYQAVSGASTVITSPTTATGTNGVPFSYRITTGPQAANQFNATPLPPGLTVATSSGRITGTPTAVGFWNVKLTASDSGIPSRTLTTNLALTIVAASISPPSISTQPQNQTVTAGANIAFSVIASGSAPLSYQWRFGSSNLAGQTAASLNLTGVTLAQAGSYSVVVANSGGSVTSSPAILTVNQAPIITTQPQSQMVLAGGTANFFVIATGLPAVTYQWRFAGADLSGQTTSALQLTSVTTNQAGNYTVVVSNSIGSVTSAPALLTVNAAIVPPGISTPPQSQGVVAGGNVTFSVVATGTAPLSYQWTFNGGALAGRTTSALTLASVTTNQAGSYAVIVTNSAGSVTSASAVLTVTQPITPPVITGQPQSKTVVAGSNTTFSVSASGSGPLAYQWLFQSTNLPGKTAGTLSLNNVATSQHGAYSVIVSNPGGSVTSAPAILTVIVSQPGTDPKAPWKDFAGSYHGLLYDTNGVAQGSSGSFSFRLTPGGAYSVAVQLSGGYQLSGSGRMALDGTASNTLPRGVASPVSVRWAIDLTGSGQISGTAQALSGAWTAELVGDRASFSSKTNPCPYAGKYTLVLPGISGATNSPAGDSYGAVTVDANGIASVRGMLADKTVIVQKASLSRAGDWPLFVPLYSKTGGLLAWLHFENRAGDDLNGLASWIKPSQPTAQFFPAGFTIQNEIQGSRYRFGSGASGLLGWANGFAIFSDGDLKANSTNAIYFSSATQLSGADPHQLKASFNPATGLFHGSFVPPGNQQAVLFNGVVMQKGSSASGCFFGSTRSGAVRLQP